MHIYDEQVRATLKGLLSKIEQRFEADVIFYYGPIFDGVGKYFRDFVESLKANASTQRKLVLFLNTQGGSAETVEKMVEIIRFHYTDVSFVVPDYAMSAGTIFCMSGDRIYMDYFSALGPIDPQVHNGKEWVPALGYLDQVEKILTKSAAGNPLSEAELLIIQQQDLAQLSRFEQARNLTITLLKKWLVDYKFKDWETHRSDPAKMAQSVTLPEKEERAEKVAELLSDNKLWHSHGRSIGVQKVKDVLRLEVEDYSKDLELRQIFRDYNDFLLEYVKREKYPNFLHSRINF